MFKPSAVTTTRLSDVALSTQWSAAPAAATTVRLEGGNRLVKDGPVAATKEQLGGYVVLEVPDLDTALSWASRSPAASNEATPSSASANPTVSGRSQSSRMQVAGGKMCCPYPSHE